MTTATHTTAAELYAEQSTRGDDSEPRSWRIGRHSERESGNARYVPLK